MSIEEGLDHDLKLELENLTFLEDQNNSSNAKQRNKGPKPKIKPKGSKPKQTKGKNCNVMPCRTMISTSTETENAVASDKSMPRSPKGVWKTTRHGIKKRYGATHLQNYGCNVCGQLLPSRGELNEHYHNSHLPVLCPVCKKTFSCPNTWNHHLYSHNLNKQIVCDICEESFCLQQ